MIKDNLVYVEDIIDSIQQIENYMLGITLSEFLSDRLIQDGVVRNIEIIGEASKKISVDFKIRHAKIPWGKMAGMRDKLIHDYRGVEYKLVWNIVFETLPIVKTQLILILET